jgi:hypothetical protein
MKIAPCLVTASLLATAAACDTSRPGANDRIAFTPRECGQVAGCDFDDSVGVDGIISVTISGIGGQSTAGVDLASRHPTIFTVNRRSDLGGQPAWDLTGNAPGVGDLVALQDGREIDFVEVPVQAVQRLTLVPFVGDVVGPTSEAGFDEAFTVNADEAVSWFVRPVVAGGATTMGRYAFETILDAGEPSVIPHETEASDRQAGYLYVVLPADSYPIGFELSADPFVGVDAIIHALARP